MYSGPKIKQVGLTFGYDTGRNPSSAFDERFQKRRHFKGAPTVNFFPDGHFPNGTDMASEAGSNSQNDIVLLKNPGDSPYVLRQSMGVAYTEYQINLTTELSANTTYCMSGWYAESNNYSGSSRMFHARAHSSSGAHRSTGAGVYNIIKTKRVGGLLWKFAFYTITTPSDYSNSFNWYLGYLNQSYTGYRYYTNIKLEQGTRPTPYHAGTRSSTNSLIGFKKSTTIDVANISFDSDGLPTFDGTNDRITIPAGSFPTIGTNDFTIVVVAKNTKTSSYNHFFSVKDQYHFALKMQNATNTDRNIYVYRTSGLSTFSAITARATSTTSYYHIVCKREGDNIEIFLNGVSGGTKSGWNNVSIDNNTWPSYIGWGNGSEYTGGEIPVVKVYNQAFTDDEVKQNFSTYRRRFNI